MLIRIDYGNRASKLVSFEKIEEIRNLLSDDLFASIKRKIKEWKVQTKKENYVEHFHHIESFNLFANNEPQINVVTLVDEARLINDILLLKRDNRLNYVIITLYKMAIETRKLLTSDLKNRKNAYNMYVDIADFVEKGILIRKYENDFCKLEIDIDLKEESIECELTKMHNVYCLTLNGLNYSEMFLKKIISLHDADISISKENIEEINTYLEKYTDLDIRKDVESDLYIELFMDSICSKKE